MGRTGRRLRISPSFISAAPASSHQKYSGRKGAVMADGDRHRGVDAVAKNLLEDPVAATDAVAASDDDEEDFTFAAVPRVAGGGVFSDGRIGPVYPVFGRPRSPPLEEEDSDTATVRVPLGQLLLEERGSSSGQQEDGELEGVPVETYCLWSPGSSAAVSPARCRKSGSTGSVLRWRQRLVGRSHSDGKEKFVFLNTSSSERKGRSGEGGGRHGWSYYGRGGGGGNGGGRRSFLPYKQDLVGLFANAGAFRRSYHPF